MMIFSILFVFVVICSSRNLLKVDGDIHLQVIGQIISGEEFEFDQVLLNVNKALGQVSIEFEGKKTPKNLNGISKIYQITNDNKFYRTKLLDDTSKSQFLDILQSKDEASFSDKNVEDVDEVSLYECLDFNENPELLTESSIYNSDQELEDNIYIDSQGRYIIYYLNREWIVDTTEGNQMLLISKNENKQNPYTRASINLFEVSYDISFNTRWTVDISLFKNECETLDDDMSQSQKYEVIINSNGDIVSESINNENKRRLGSKDGTTGLCPDSMCCPSNIGISSCTPHKELFLAHDAYQTNCISSYVGSYCTEYSSNGDLGRICIDTHNIFQYVGSPRCYVSFSGSDSAEDWINNINTFTTTWEGYSIHSGFGTEFNGIGLTVYNALLLTNCLNYDTIEITGHSLGGAMSILLGIYIAKYHNNINIEVNTIGAPRVFKSNTQPSSFNNRYHQNAYISEWITDTWPIWYWWDYVPRLPPFQSDWIHPQNTDYIRLCRFEDVVCVWFNCVTYVTYSYTSGYCDSSSGAFDYTFEAHTRQFYYDNMDGSNYAGC